MPPRRDFFNDEPVIMRPESCISIDAKIYKIAATLLMMFHRCDEFRNLTDAAYDAFAGIVDRWTDHQHMNVADYRDAVLDWAYAECGRKGYDKIVELFDKQED